MSQTVPLNSADSFTATPAGMVKRLAVFSYGLIGYGLGNLGLFWLILAAAGLAPTGLTGYRADSVGLAILVNCGLILLFGLQHSIMARPWFKQALRQWIPEAAERVTYMLMSGVVTVFALYTWQPLPGMVWSVEQPVLEILLLGLCAAGWLYLVFASFVTNHFELMGLRQITLYLLNRPYTPLPFTSRFMYRYSRHPMMLGMLVGLWAVPHMTLTHLVLSMTLTVYMAIGLFFEERDLLKQFGDTYRQYRNRVATFIPKIF